MLIDKSALLALIESLPDATPVASADPLQVQLDEANASLADAQKKNSDLQATLDSLVIKDGELQTKEASEAAVIEKVKEDLQ